MLDKNPYLALILVIVSALALSFSLHITYHYHVHFKTKTKALDRFIDFLYSILTGLPFHFYYLLHINHHVYNNEIGDFTSTITRNDGNIQNKNIFTYGLFWFKASRKPREMMQSGINEKYFSEELRKKTKYELLVIILFEILIGIYSWKLLLMYFALIYFGWMFISFHNYGQHLPIKQGIDIGNSYYNAFYNYIFVNNGLHYEHHKYPETPYWELANEKDENLNNKLPHLFDGFRFLLNQ